MSSIRLLFVEDNKEDLATCRDTVSRYREEHQREVEIVECTSAIDAIKELDNSFDGAIIDLRLADQGDGGNQVIEKIAESLLRIPVAILTGTPEEADRDFTNVGVFKKGDKGAGYADLFDLFWGIRNTGLTRIMGGRGVIEQTLTSVYLNNLLPQIEKWVQYGATDSDRTEKSLLRYALHHLLQLLDDDSYRYFPEEMYLYPTLEDKVRTGSIVKQSNGDLFAVMNPACDLVIRKNGTFKTDRILLVEIEEEGDVISPALNGITNESKRKKKLQTILGNNHTDYYHWLPKTDFFAGGFLNFRKLSTVSQEGYSEEFLSPDIQISPAFVKDMVARFSSYYARQGQPEIECNEFIAQLASAKYANEG